MNPSIFDVYDACVDFGQASYARPCIILEETKGGCFSAVPVSSAPELYRGLPFHFKIEDTDFDFKSTGLKRSSYAAGDEVVELENNLLRKRGRLEGDLLTRFKQWIT